MLYQTDLRGLEVFNNNNKRIKRIIAIAIFVSSSHFCNAQTKIDKIIAKMKYNYVTNCKQPVKPNFYYNKVENVLKVVDNQIPILEVSVKYQLNTMYPKFGIHYVKFSCILDESCIVTSDGTSKSVGISVPFKTKADCYTFINLLSDLKIALTD